MRKIRVALRGRIMRHPTASPLLRSLRQLVEDPCLARLNDAALLHRFRTDHDEAAFLGLVRRHGPMVLGVCRGVLGNEADAEDVFQATFLVLAQKCATIKQSASVASWLHGVAFRTAMRARTDAAKRHDRESRYVVPDARRSTDDLSWREIQQVVHVELDRLSDEYRAALVLCYLEGKTQDQAAVMLGTSEATVKKRLERGRALLRIRLSRRGLGSVASLMVSAWPATVPLSGALSSGTVAAAVEIGMGRTAAGLVSERVIALTTIALNLLAAPHRKIGLALLLLATLALSAGGVFYDTYAAAPPRSEKRVEQPASTPVVGDPLPAGATTRLGTQRFRHDSWVESLVPAPDGKSLYVASGLSVRLWDRVTGKELRRLAGPLPDARDNNLMSPPRYSRLALSPDGKMLAVGTQGTLTIDYEILLLDTATGREIRRLDGHAMGVKALAFSPDGKLLASCGGNMAARLWDPATGKEVGRLGAEKTSLAALAFSPDGKHLVTADDSAAEVRIWDVGRRTEVRRLRGLAETAWTVAYSADGKLLATGGGRGELVLWDATTGKELRRIRGLFDPVIALAFSPDDRHLVSGAADKTLRLWNCDDGTEVRRIGEHASSVFNVTFLDKGTTLVTWGSENSVRFWDAATGRERESPPGHRVVVKAVALSPKGTILATGAADSTIRLWDISRGKELRQMRTDGDVAALDFAPDGASIASAGYDGSVRVWDTASGRELQRLRKGRGWVTAVAFSPNGRSVAAGGETGWLTVWDARTGKEVLRLDDYYYEGMGCGLAFNPDGATLAYASRQGFGTGGLGIVCLTDVATGKELRRIRAGTNGGVTCLAFSPDGRTLLTGGLDHTVRLFEVATGAERRLLKASNPKVACTVNAVAYSTDGRLIAWTAVEPDRGSRLRVWDVIRDDEQPAVEGHNGPITSLGFSADGRSLASGSTDTTALLWDAGKLVAPLKRPATPVKAAELEPHWTALRGETKAAYRALIELVRADATTFLGERLRPARPADDKVVARHLTDLASEDFAVREKASAALAELGASAEGQLHQAAAKATDVETRRRIDRLLTRFRTEALRTQRALEVLELMGTREAAEVLRTLSLGAANPEIARDAKARLHRLTQRGTPQ